MIDLVIAASFRAALKKGIIISVSPKNFGAGEWKCVLGVCKDVSVCMNLAIF